MNDGSVTLNNNAQDSQMINAVRGLNSNLTTSTTTTNLTSMQNINKPDQFTIISPDEVSLIAFAQCDVDIAQDQSNPLNSVAITACQLYNAGIAVQIIYKSFNEYIDSLILYVNNIEEEYLQFLTNTTNNTGIVNQTLTQYKNKDKLIATSKKRLTAYKQFMINPYNSVCDLLIEANNQNTKKENKLQEYAEFTLNNNTLGINEPSEILKNATISSRLVNQIILENNKLRRIVEQLNTQIVAWNNFPNNLSSGVIAFSGATGFDNRRKPENIIVTTLVENIATAFANSGGNKFKTELYIKLSEQQTKLSRLQIRSLKSRDIQPINANTLARTVEERKTKKVLPITQEFKQPKTVTSSMTKTESNISDTSSIPMSIDDQSTVTSMDLNESMQINVSAPKQTEVIQRQNKRKNAPKLTEEELQDDYSAQSRKIFVIPNEDILKDINLLNYKYKLSTDDLKALTSKNEFYTDTIINRALEQIVKESNGKYDTIDSIELANCKISPETIIERKTRDTIFIAHNKRRQHWILCLFKSVTKSIYTYDSLPNSKMPIDILGQDNVNCIKEYFGPVEFYSIELQKQPNGYDCGPFAVAGAVALLYGESPENVSFNIATIRTEIYDMIKTNKITKMYSVIQSPLQKTLGDELSSESKFDLYADDNSVQNAFNNNYLNLASVSTVTSEDDIDENSVKIILRQLTNTNINTLTIIDALKYSKIQTNRIDLNDFCYTTYDLNKYIFIFVPIYLLRDNQSVIYGYYTNLLNKMVLYKPKIENDKNVINEYSNVKLELVNNCYKETEVEFITPILDLNTNENFESIMYNSIQLCMISFANKYSIENPTQVTYTINNNLSINENYQILKNAYVE